MKRREFIVNSALLVGGTALLSGCKDRETAVNTDTDADVQISRRNFKDLSIPLLGFGCMRLPKKGNEVDMRQLDKMVAYAMAHGVNYFDTAYMYMDGKSESTMGKALKKYDRKSYFLATKNPIRLLNSKADILKIFDEQLKRCQTDYFDFYMAHNINSDTIDKYREYSVYDELLKMKQAGKIKNLGFSFHGDVDMLKNVVKEHKWDFCMLQLNYFDWDAAKVDEMYEIASKANLPVIVMEPLRGGGLCKLTPKAQNLLKENCPADTPASYALRWIAGKERVFTILSGMSNFQHVEENIATLSDFKPLTAKEAALSKELVKIIKAQGEINCTDCKYCVGPCPRGVNIPAIFTMYNTYKLFDNKFFFMQDYKALKDSEKADRCIDCKACNTHCPQGLDIPKLLKQIDAEYKNA